MQPTDELFNEDLGLCIESMCERLTGPEVSTYSVGGGRREEVMCVCRSVRIPRCASHVQCLRMPAVRNAACHTARHHQPVRCGPGRWQGPDEAAPAPSRGGSIAPLARTKLSECGARRSEGYVRVCVGNTLVSATRVYTHRSVLDIVWCVRDDPSCVRTSIQDPSTSS